jgi:hypothetical protein
MKSDHIQDRSLAMDEQYTSVFTEEERAARRGRGRRPEKPAAGPPRRQLRIFSPAPWWQYWP